ncbi:hypothetical protein niasHT_005890 [Heterodera trifolii]|uniref:B30.2/SPRY domain-containing protein n=1 Tax=Heterodera trifolii TaxID=157864 RepID=A0ABD2LZ56_9BILA
MREIQNALAEKTAGNEAKLEKQIENVKSDNQNAFFYFHSLPIYQWNASDCHPKILINKSTNAIQRNATGREGVCSCRAGPIQMPSAAAGRIGIIYTEYRILADNGALSIGLSPKEMPLEAWLGLGSVSYDSGGVITSTNASGLIIWEIVPSFCIGDVVGCGLNWATRQVFFTNNGQRLNITNLYIEEDTDDLYPTVSLSHHGDVVEANFGPNFKYDLSNEF